MKQTVKIITTLIVVSLLLFNCGGDSDLPTPKPPTPSPPISQAPGSVTLLSPINNKACEEGVIQNSTEREITFSWGTSVNTETYDLIITNLTTNQVTLVTGLVNTSNKINLKKGTPYSWSVISRSAKNSETATSSVWKLYVSAEGITNYAPFPATLNAPLSGAIVSTISNKVTLDWTGMDLDSKVLNYTIYLDKVDGKQIPKTEYSNLSTQKLDVAVEPNSYYFWRVKTSDGQNSSYTIVYTFKTN